MPHSLRSLLLAALVAIPLAACHDDGRKAALPAPTEPTAASIAQFCDMAVLDHPGPKGQIFLKGRSAPLWFASVRDAVAYTMLPENHAGMAAIYVNDMARAHNWDRPEPGTWVEARSAWYVLGSNRTGGMGGPEPIPFSIRTAADAFAAAHGGRVVRFAGIPRDAVLGGDTSAGDAPAPASMPGMKMDGANHG